MYYFISNSNILLRKGFEGTLESVDCIQILKLILRLTSVDTCGYVYGSRDVFWGKYFMECEKIVNTTLCLNYFPSGRFALTVLRVAKKN